MQLSASRIVRKSLFQQTIRILRVSILLAVVATGPAVRAQQTTPLPEPRNEPHQSQSARGKSAEIPPVALFVMLDRKSIVFPDIASNFTRLSTGKKFELFVDNSLSLHGLAGAALGAGMSQAVNTPGGYGQGGTGYANRFGSSMARLASSNFFGTFLLASALHEDPRFFPKREPTIGQGVKYSLERVVVTRNDEGRDVRNWSGLLGPLLSESLANAYWPEADRTAGQTFRRYGIDLAVRAGTNMLREYWPVLARKMRRSRPAEAP